MKAFGVLLVALVAEVGAEKVGTQGSSLQKQILEKMTEMAQNLHNEGKQAKTTWAKEKCECDESKESLTNQIEAKAEAIATAEADKESARASAQVASQQVADSKAAIEQATKDMDAATTNRNKEREAFTKEKNELEALMATLVNAIDDLASGSDAFLQTGKLRGNGKWIDATRQMLQDIMPMMSEEDSETTESFLQQPNKQMIEQVSLTLQGLKKQFAAQLEDSTDAENTAQAAYDNFMQKTDEMKTLNQNLLASARRTLANTDQRVADANEVIDHEGLQGLKDDLESKTEYCAFEEKRYNEHSVLRQQEQAAVQEALTLLGSDDAKDLFNALDDHADRKNPAFLLQIKSSLRRIKIASARAPVGAEDGGSHSKLGKVIDSIDKQKAELDQADADDKAWDGECVALMEQLDSDLLKAQEKISELRESKSTTEEDRDNFQQRANEAADESAFLRKSMHETTVNYNQTTAQFDAAVRDQTSALELLGKVVTALDKFYAEDVRAKHSESDASADYKQSDKANPVLNLLESLQNEVAKNMETEQTDQVEATQLYQDNMTEMTTSLAASDKLNSEMNASVNSANASLENLSRMLEETLTQEKMLQKEKDDNQPRCHFIKTNLQTRLAHRSLEKDGLKGARDALSAAQPVTPAPVEEEFSGNSGFTPTTQE